MREKLETVVDFPLEDFDLSNYQMCPSDTPAIYDLMAVSVRFSSFLLF